MKSPFLILLIFFVCCNHKTTSVSETEVDGNSKVSGMSFHLEHSLRIPNYKVDIELNKKFNGIFLHVTSAPMAGHPGWEKTIVDTTYKIEQALFDKVLSSIQKISGEDLQSAGERGFDGTSCEIKFGDSQNYISYAVWSPDYYSKKRKTGDFLNACKQFIKAANLDPKDIL